MTTIKIPANLLNARSFHGYDSATKDEFHKAGKKLLRAIGQQVYGDKSLYTVRSCLGGPAVLGEVILHSDTYYIQLHQGFFSDGKLQFLHRCCNGRTDYSGGVNQYLDIDDISTLTMYMNVHQSRGA